MNVLTHFLKDRITQLVKEEDQQLETSDMLVDGEAEDIKEVENEEIEGFPMPSASKTKVISEQEINAFKDFELRLIDNEDYFKAIFG